MCIIRGSTIDVSNTQILVAPITNNNNKRQLTVYANKVKLNEDAGAMILPFPKSDCELIDLSDYKQLFKDLDRACFPVVRRRKAKAVSNSRAAKQLDIIQVGSYKASIVPSKEDFLRLQNDVFGVPENIMNFLKEKYGDDFSFVVCLLDREKEYHPFGYIHSLTSSNTMMVPTVHYHEHKDGSITADWSHSIYSVNYPLTTDFGPMNKKADTSRDHSINVIKWNKLPNQLDMCRKLYGYKISKYSKNHDCFSTAVCK